jgi:methylated-DNA-[protein]-cysteine S-methyltransferase
MSSVHALVLDHLTTPIGTMLVAADASGSLRALDWEEYVERMLRLLRLHYGRQGFALSEGRAPASIREPLERYFAGELDALASIPVATGGTSFQREVWAALRSIPAGETLSYGALAAAIGRPAAVRAVGHANGSNPIGVVVPCHRVIGKDASLTGYAGGIERKRWLLGHERASA